MASIVPRRLSEKRTFFTTHLPAFTEHAASIGLTEQDIADLEAKLAAADLAASEQAAAQLAAQAATAEYNRAMAELADVGATLILKIRTTAETTDDPSVYTRALLPPPAKRSPIEAPGKPTDFRSSVNAIGEVTITWDCPNPKGSSGTIYQVRRREEPSAKFNTIGIAGERRFVDSGIPKGATWVEYQVQAVRSTAVGPASPFVVSFGSNGNAMPAMFIPAKQERQFAA